MTMQTRSAEVGQRICLSGGYEKGSGWHDRSETGRISCFLPDSAEQRQYDGRHLISTTSLTAVVQFDRPVCAVTIDPDSRTKLPQDNYRYGAIELMFVKGEWKDGDYVRVFLGKEHPTHHEDGMFADSHVRLALLDE
jgi:hypothetical protein